jgi:hypothetical protein
MSRFLFSALIINLLLFYISCKENKTKDKEFQFYYYPQKNVYYNPLNRNFLYSLDGGKSWNSFINNNTDSLPNTLGEKVVIYSADTNILADNQKHRKLYNGVLYEITTDDTTRIVGAEVSERKVVVTKKAVAAKSAASKAKKGFAGFIDKIFGKRKK